MFQLIRPANGVTALWMIVLPMVAYGFVLLPRAAALALVLVSLGLLTRRVVTAWGWDFVPEVLPQFVLSILFTLVFTMIAVRTERSRTEVARLAGELRQANRRLSEYAVQAEELATTRERNRMAREIHDTVGHVLTVVNVQLEAARAMLSHDPCSTQDSINKAQELTQQGLRDIRNSVATLRASPLDGCSLAAALQKLITESMSDGQTTELLVRGAPRPLPAATELSLYRAGQEGLTNARRHAAALHVKLVLDYESDRAVRLTITDDGCGTNRPTDGYGLLGLRERAVLLGGNLTVRSSPGEGFELSIEAPT
jgi:signal transduction histidine kinase